MSAWDQPSKRHQDLKARVQSTIKRRLHTCQWQTFTCYGNISIDNKSRISDTITHCDCCCFLISNRKKSILCGLLHVILRRRDPKDVSKWKDRAVATTLECSAMQSKESVQSYSRGTDHLLQRSRKSDNHPFTIDEGPKA